MKLKYFFFVFIIFSTSIIFSYTKGYYLFEKNLTKNDHRVSETLKILKKLIVFTATFNFNASSEEIQKLLSQYFAYHLIFDNDLILNNTHFYLMKDQNLISALGVQFIMNKELVFLQQLSKRHQNKAFLYAEGNAEEEIIHIVYTAFNSPNTFILSFTQEAFSPVKIELLEKMNAKSFNLSPLTETNKLLSDEFMSENIVLHHKFDYRTHLAEKYDEILLLFLLQGLLLLGASAINTLTNLKKARILDQFYLILETHAEQETIDKVIEQKETLLKLKSIIKNTETQKDQLKKIAEINKKSVKLERNINKTIARDLDQDLQKISQLATDSINHFDSMPGQLLQNLLTTIKNSTAKLLFLKNSHLPVSKHKVVNIKNCLEKTFIIFGPDLYDMECQIDIVHFEEALHYPCSEIILIQLFNGILNRLLFSMEPAKGNFIKVNTEKEREGFKLIFENSSLGIHPPGIDAMELISPFLSVPNWVSTKAIAKILNISIEESFILAKGDTLILKFNGLHSKNKSLNENVYSFS